MRSHVFFIIFLSLLLSPSSQAFLCKVSKEKTGVSKLKTEFFISKESSFKLLESWKEVIKKESLRYLLDLPYLHARLGYEEILDFIIHDFESDETLSVLEFKNKNNKISLKACLKNLTLKGTLSARFINSYFSQKFSIKTNNTKEEGFCLVAENLDINWSSTATNSPSALFNARPKIKISPPESGDFLIKLGTPYPRLLVEIEKAQFSFEDLYKSKALEGVQNNISSHIETSLTTLKSHIKIQKLTKVFLNKMSDFQETRQALQSSAQTTYKNSFPIFLDEIYLTEEGIHIKTSLCEEQKKEPSL